ncbi:MAG: hypothetical protein JST39_04785 [Bacteroidetes bacterium]|nr:hypothetical protein [Bacteroidota bacterium]
MGRLYGDYIQMLCELVISLGKIPIVWADIALKYPGALKRLPPQTIFIDWNYGWDPSRFGDHKKLLESGFRIWGAPAIRSGPDNYYLTSWQKHFDNLGTFIPLAQEWGYEGIITTSWSTSGIYSPVFESASDVIELNALRRVYPLTGFNLLITAAAEAGNNPGQLNGSAFIIRYCKERYGFTPQQSLDFWKALTAAPFEIASGRVTGTNLSITSLQDSVTFSRKVLYGLKPQKNAVEFSHYLLMIDIRAFYVACKKVEEAMNRPGFRSGEAPALLQVLRSLHPGELNDRFIKLNSQTYHLSELELENATRNARYYQLKELLEHIR